MSFRSGPVIVEHGQHEAQRAVWVGMRGVDIERFHGGCLRSRHRLREPDARQRRQKSMALGQPRPGSGGADVPRENALEAFHRAEVSGARPPVTVIPAFQVQLVEFAVHSLPPVHLGRAQRHPERADYRAGNLVLEAENIREPVVEALRPDVVPVGGAESLRRIAEGACETRIGT